MDLRHSIVRSVERRTFWSLGLEQPGTPLGLGGEPGSPGGECVDLVGRDASVTSTQLYRHSPRATADRM